MILHTIKKQLPKFYTHIQTALVVLVLFMLQFVAVHGSLEFYKDPEFWTSLVITLSILFIINEIYWKNGSARGELNTKYLGSSVEYSIRVNRIKNNNPPLVDDFYSFIDERNIKLFIEARNELLDANNISRNDYYYGVCSVDTDSTGRKNLKYSTPHCELSETELKSLTKPTINGGTAPYYTSKQVQAIINAVKGNFKYEKLSAAEILSGTQIESGKYNTHYDAKKNKRKFALSNAMVSVVIATLGAMLGYSLVTEGWSPVALFLFLYRLAMVAWRAVNSDEGGYVDIAETKRTVNINRSNVMAIYAKDRNNDTLYADLDTEISEALKLLGAQLGKEIPSNGSK